MRQNANKIKLLKTEIKKKKKKNASPAPIMYKLLFALYLVQARSSLFRFKTPNDTKRNLSPKNDITHPKRHFQVFPAPYVHPSIIRADFLKIISINCKQSSSHRRSSENKAFLNELECNGRYLA